MWGPKLIKRDRIRGVIRWQYLCLDLDSLSEEAFGVVLNLKYLILFCLVRELARKGA